MNAIKHGANSQLIKRAVKKICEDPELIGFLVILNRLANSGEIPSEYKDLLRQASEQEL